MYRIVYVFTSSFDVSRIYTALNKRAENHNTCWGQLTRTVGKRQFAAEEQVHEDYEANFEFHALVWQASSSLPKYPFTSSFMYRCIAENEKIQGKIPSDVMNNVTYFGTCKTIQL